MDCGKGLKGWSSTDTKSSLEVAKENGCITAGVHSSGTVGTDDKYTGLKGPMVDFVNNLASMAKPYAVSPSEGETGNSQCVLYFGFKGHHNHLHVSNTD